LFNPIQNTTNTFDFSPSGADFILAAFSRCQVKPTEISPSHMYHARMALNFVLSEWSNQQPNLWEVELQIMPLTQGVATYAMPQPTVMILDMYITLGATPTNDRYLYPISRTDYASYTDKTVRSVPTVYWYDRLISQTVTFYPMPDGGGPYTAKFYSVRQTQDADVKNGKQVEIPYRFYEAYCAGLAWKLSEMYAPALEDKLFMRYQRSWNIAITNDVENVELYIAPGIGSYYEQ
jgi:hypothetical protein